ncbi:MAG: beta-lactamase family protein [Bdellovibrionales bacterium]|nr:beta-lactamase family protein [Bdellovibrionales bacterium]
MGKQASAAVLRRAVFAISVVALAAFTQETPRGTVPSFQERIENDQVVQKLFTQFSGVIQVAVDGDALYEAAHGPLDRYPYSDGTSMDLSADDLFPIASMTKQFVAALILRRVQDGELGLTTSIADILPGIPPSWRRIQIMHLLTHSSGIADHLSDNLIEAFRNSNLSHAEIFESLKKVALRVQPGLRPAQPAPRLNSSPAAGYSNGNYLALALILEKLWEKKHGHVNFWPQILKAEILSPFGLRDTWVLGLNEVPPRLLVGFEQPRLGLFLPAPLLRSPLLYGCGDMTSNIHDLSRWLRILFETELVLKAPFRNLMMEAISGDYTYGGRVGFLEKKRFHLRTGTLKGYHHSLVYFPDLKLSIVVLSHQDGSPVKALTERIAKIVIGIP